MTDTASDATRVASSGAVRVALAIVLACCLTLGAVAAPASAGDGVTIFFFEPEDPEADAGETVTLELVVSDHGDYSGNGVDNLSASIAYDPAVITVTDVEHGPMLANGCPDAEVDGTVEIDDEAGALTIEQERTPSGEGAITTATAATLTLEIAADAEPTTATIDITDSSTTLITDYPQNTVERPAEIAIEGGDSAAESDAASADSSSAPDSDDSADEDEGADGPDGVTLADDLDDGDSDDGSNAGSTEGADDGPTEETANSSDEDATGDGEDSSTDGRNEGCDTADSDTDDGDDSEGAAAVDSIPGFAVPAVVVAIAAWLGLRVRCLR